MTTRILVIEDDISVLDNIIDFLEAEGYSVIAAKDGTTGVNCARESVPDLIITDVMMPGMNGYEVLETLQAEEDTSLIPFIFLTAKVTREDMRKGMTMGASDYITKPFTADELLNAVEARLKIKEKTEIQRTAQMDELRNNIMYALPHELRTPLNTILGFSHLLEDGGVNSIDEVASYAQHITLAGERLKRLMENYLTYAQIELKFALDAETADTVTETAMIIEKHAMDVSYHHSREHDLRLNIVDHPICIGEESLGKIIAEITDNAFKFSEPGKPVTIKSRVPGDNYEILIIDQGQGMSPKQVKQVGAYMQFDRAFHEQQGVGLGLAIAKRLTELYDGNLMIKSKLNQGTYVWISLQMCQGEI